MVAFISGAEIFIVFFVVLILFGSKQIPEIAQMLGKGMREFNKATTEIKRELDQNELRKDIKDISDNIKQEPK